MISCISPEVVGLAVTFLVGGIVGMVVAAMNGAEGAAPGPPEHECPYCGERLRPITVQDVEDPFPAEARWICPDCDPRRYFADRPAGKPDPLPEEV